MEMLYLLIAFVIGGVVGGVIIGMWHRANSQGGDEALTRSALGPLFGKVAFYPQNVPLHALDLLLGGNQIFAVDQVDHALDAFLWR